MLVTADVILSSLIIFTFKMQAKRSSETLVLTRATGCQIPKDGIIHSHCRENLKYYIALTGWAL
jgi:hypothetical protein